MQRISSLCISTPFNTFINRIIHGDCVQVMRQMPEAIVDLVVTDPPYLVNYSDRRGRRVANDNNGSWIEPAFAEVYRLLKPDRLCISFYGWNHTETSCEPGKQPDSPRLGTLSGSNSTLQRLDSPRHGTSRRTCWPRVTPEKPVEPPADVRDDWRYTGNRLHPTQVDDPNIAANWCVTRRARQHRLLPTPAMSSPRRSGAVVSPPAGQGFGDARRSAAS